MNRDAGAIVVLAPVFALSPTAGPPSADGPDIGDEVAFRVRRRFRTICHRSRVRCCADPAATEIFDPNEPTDPDRNVFGLLRYAFCLAGLDNPSLCRSASDKTYARLV